MTKETNLKMLCLALLVVVLLAGYSSDDGDAGRAVAEL